MKHLSLVTCITCALGAAQLFALTEAQKTEFAREKIISLYNESGEKTAHFSVAFSPGSENWMSSYPQAMEQAQISLTQLVEKDSAWYQRLYKRFRKSFNFVNQETHQQGLCAIIDDYSATKAEHAKCGTAAPAVSTRAYNWLQFGGVSTVRVMRSSIALLFAAPYSVAAPLLHKAWEPAAPTASEAPVFSYEWHETEWVLLETPSEAAAPRMTVSYVPVLAPAPTPAPAPQ